MDKPKNAMNVINICNETIYPYIFLRFLIKILITLPISYTTNKRTFSQRIKT